MTATVRTRDECGPWTIRRELVGGAPVVVARAWESPAECDSDEHAQREWRLGRKAVGIARAAAGLEPDTSSITFPHSQRSLSHTAGVAVAVATTADVAGVGIDVEFRHPSPAAARFFLTPNERAAPEDLQRLWTVKEALFKADPGNAATVLTDYEVDDPRAMSGAARSTPNPRLTFRYRSRRDGFGFETVAVALLAGDA